MNEVVYLNGDFIDKSEAKISANDRGFIFADGVYEVVKYYNGKAFRYDDHLARLRRSLAELDIKFDAIENIARIFEALLEINNLSDKHAGLYLQISRGEHKRVHHFPENIEPTVYVFAYQMPSFTNNLENGIKTITHDDIRWQRCDIKSVSLLPNTMLFNKAVQKDADECILIRDGYITEATHSSVLGVKNGTVITRPLSNLILPGITRKVILEICAANGIPFEERAFSAIELFDMDELIIAGTGSEVTPAVSVNELPVGNGKPGEITRLIQKKFFELV
ncbi:MAG TPA: D-amino-acid transaminase [Prolixibacteraceae bacterium]|nr:D-amino-acid transaminase [Prolixibacteraceae bacterium]